MASGGQTVEFAHITEDSGMVTGADGNRIYYSDDFLSGGEDLEGDEAATMTFDVVLVHELGHTNAGAAAEGQTTIMGKSPTTSINSSGEVTFTRYKNYAEEFRAVRFFENRYRQELGLPLRRSYFDVNDVPKPLVGN